MSTVLARTTTIVCLLGMFGCGKKLPVSHSQTAIWHREDLGGDRLLRHHLWELFAAITAPLERDPHRATWEGWYPISALGSPSAPKLPAAVPVEPSRQALDELRKSGKREEKDLQKLPIASVYFNPAAYRHIKQKKLDDPNVMSDLAKRSSAVPEFPPDAIALKAIWKLVRRHHPPDPPSCVSVYSGKPPDPAASGGRITPDDATYYRELAAVFPEDLAAYGEIKQCYVEGWGVPVAVSGVLVLNRPDIYVLRITPDMMTHDSFLNQIEAQPGDALFLAGLHLSTKEVPEWVWATWWWNDQAKGDRLHDLPNTVHLDARWNSFLLDTTLSMGICQTEKKFVPRRFGNPYFEFNNPNGIFDNCLTCHRQAMWTAKAPLSGPDHTVCPSPDDLKAMTLDFMWSLHRSYPTSQ